MFWVFFPSLVLETGVFYEVWDECWVELYFPRLFNFPRSELRRRVTFLFRGQRISQRSLAGLRGHEKMFMLNEKRRWDPQSKQQPRTLTLLFPVCLLLSSRLSYLNSGTIFVLNFWQKTSLEENDTGWWYSVHVRHSVGWFLVSTWLQTLLIILLLLPAARNGDDVQNQMRARAVFVRV